MYQHMHMIVQSTSETCVLLLTTLALRTLPLCSPSTVRTLQGRLSALFSVFHS